MLHSAGFWSKYLGHEAMWFAMELWQALKTPPSLSVGRRVSEQELPADRPEIVRNATPTELSQCIQIHDLQCTCRIAHPLARRSCKINTQAKDMRPHLLSQYLLEFRLSGVRHAAQVVGHGRRGYGVVARLGRVWPATVARRVSVFQVCPTRTQPALQVWSSSCQAWLG